MSAKPKVYLAGPISGCNTEQRDAWRKDIRQGFSDEFDFIDPTDQLIDANQANDALVQADAEAIQSADAILANMWRESIGTSFGVLTGHLAGKIVVVCDQNLIGSRMLAFYADAVERSPTRALNAIRMFLRSERLITGVSKQDGSIEPFERSKMSLAVRRACQTAKTGDLVPSRAIVAKTLTLLLEDQTEERVIPSTKIREVVWEAIATLAADPLNEGNYEAIRRAWEGSEEAAPTQTKATGGVVVTPRIHPEPLEVRVSSAGTHSTIWGHAIAKEATGAFNEIRRVEGVTQIILGPFRNTHSPPSKLHLRLQASKTPTIIEGNCYDKGPKGTLQTFQIRVADANSRDAILYVLREHLGGLGYIRSVVFSAD